MADNADKAPLGRHRIPGDRRHRAMIGKDC